LQDRCGSGDTGHNAQFDQPHGSSGRERTDAAQRVVAIDSDDRRSVAPTDVLIAPAALEFAE
jgi:hypothetical protein